MSKKVKIFIAAIVVLNLMIGAGIYANHQLDKFIAILSNPGTDLSSLLQDLPSNNAGTAPNQDPHQSGSSPSQNEPESEYPGNLPAAPDDGSPDQDQVIGDIEKRLGQSVDKKDLVKGAMILLRKLDSEEIRFLYEVGKKERQTQAELRKAREILTTKLNKEDLKVLRELGAKYGRNLNFL